MKPKAAGTFLSLRRPATQATRRAKSGSERYPLLSSALFTLFAPSAATNKTVYLIDLRGEVVHTWEMPYPPGYGYLTERGTLFYNGKIPNQSRIGRAAYMCGAALEMDWKGKCFGRCVILSTHTTASG
jgi:hypothetical protein